jgi:hypothetical protein
VTATGALPYEATLEVAPVLGVDPAPSRLELAAPWPSPARSQIRVSYSVPGSAAGAALELAIFDLAGRRTYTLARGVAISGRGEAHWDLRDAAGARVANGVYLARLRVGDVTRTARLLVVR